MKKVAVTATKYLLGIISLTSVFTLRAERPDHLWLGADISGTTFDESRGSSQQIRREILPKIPAL